LQKRARQLATGRVEGNRQWYVNKAGQTLVVIPGPVEFLMGSPNAEYAREPGWLEAQHQKRISRSFAIMTHEVTVEQFLLFQKDFSYSRPYSPEPDCPVSNITWYDAAAYCNWLSGQEGIPEDQWCYLTNEQDEYAKGMKPAAGYLQRIGYRLPTEAEWEFACRAGTMTCRYYGETENLLDQYARCTKDSTRDRAMLPVGSLKPNDLGLFDMLGNTREWCQENIHYYSVPGDGRPSEDLGDESEVSDDQHRVLRGGFFIQPIHVRSARRGRAPVTIRDYNIGMRVARTCP
jgi:formylglycine-generating enzyme required for sulfatase activity